MTTSAQQSLASGLRSLPCPLVMSQQFAALLLLLTPNIPPESLKKGHPSAFPERDKITVFVLFFFVLLGETNATPPRHLQDLRYSLSYGAGSQIQGRQLETPLSTVDSSEVVGPKAARTLGSVALGYKSATRFPLSCSLRSLLEEPFDLNQNPL